MLLLGGEGFGLFGDASLSQEERLAAIGEGIRELSDLMDAEDARRAEAQQEILSEPAAWQARAEAQAQAEAAAEASWQPGNAVTDAGQAMDGVDLEAEI